MYKLYIIAFPCLKMRESIYQYVRGQQTWPVWCTKREMEKLSINKLSVPKKKITCWRRKLTTSSGRSGRCQHSYAEKMNTYRNSSKIGSIGPGQRPHQPCLSAPAGPARSLLAENKKLEVRVVRIGAWPFTHRRRGRERRNRHRHGRSSLCCESHQ